MNLPMGTAWEPYQSGIDVVVGKAGLGRVVVTVHRVDDAIGVISVHDRGGGRKEKLQLAAGEVAVG